MSVMNIGKNNFENEVINSNKKVLVDFYASWCGPCRMLSPIIEEIANEREDIKVVKINVDAEPELSAQYGIMSIPTLMVFESGKIIHQMMGARPKDDILDML